VVSRRAVLAAGLVLAGLYAALAAVSGHLSPLARGPLLDGIGPPQPYRWVDPPPALAAANRPPSSGVFHVPLKANGSDPEVFVTSDNQVTVIVPQGAFDAKAGQIEVRLSVNPLDPSTLSSPAGNVTIFGNAYRLRATYQPSGETAPLALPLDVIMLYPVTAELHASVHQLYTSPDGEIWTAQEGSDSLAQQQAEGPMPALGDVMVAGKPGASTTGPSPTGSSGSSTAIILLVVAACVGLMGLGLLVRGRGDRSRSASGRRRR
jgi:hypothetical protein